MLNQQVIIDSGLPFGRPEALLRMLSHQQYTTPAALHSMHAVRSGCNRALQLQASQVARQLALNVISVRA